MSWLPNPIACDVCGAIKQPTNHWWYAEIRPDTHEEVNAVFAIYPWDYPAEDRTKPYIHLCGQACAARKLNEFMSPQPRSQDSGPAPAMVSQHQERPEDSQPQWTPQGPMTDAELEQVFYTPDRRLTDPQ